MVTLYWAGFPALMNWLARGEVPVDGCVRTEKLECDIPPASPESARERAERWADEAAAVPGAPARWGNFR
jgi:hypothetical protein